MIIDHATPATQNEHDKSIRYTPSHDSNLQQAQTFFLLKYLHNKYILLLVQVKVLFIPICAKWCKVHIHTILPPVGLCLCYIPKVSFWVVAVFFLCFLIAPFGSIAAKTCQSNIYDSLIREIQPSSSGYCIYPMKVTQLLGSQKGHVQPTKVLLIHHHLAPDPSDHFSLPKPVLSP